MPDQPFLRPADGDVRGSGRRARGHEDDLRPAAASVHAGSAGSLPVHPRPARPAQGNPRQSARPVVGAGRLPVPPAMPARARPMRRRSRPTCPRWTETSCAACAARTGASADDRSAPGRAPDQALQDRRGAVPADPARGGRRQLRHQRARDRGAGRGERQRQVHHRAHAGQDLPAHLRGDLLRGQAALADPLAPRPATLQRPGADGVPGPVRLDQPGVPGPARRAAQPEAAPPGAVRGAAARPKRPGCSRWSG